MAAIIRRKASRMIGRAGLRCHDRGDIEHDLLQHVLTRRDRYDRARGTWPAFVALVVERYGENLIRSRIRLRSRNGPVGPLLAVPAPDGATSERVRAVAAALDQLPEPLRVVAEEVMCGTVAGAARTLGIARSTVYDRLREIRTRLEKTSPNVPW